jgi:hypothetical protein
MTNRSAIFMPSQKLSINSVQILGVMAASALAALLTGCGASAVQASNPVSPSGTLTGNVYGGTQAVNGATVKMYAVGATGYASAATPILNSGVTLTTNSSGAFSLTGQYSCPSANSLVYVTATGGDSGKGANSALALMTALGQCGNLASLTTIQLNEVSTVAAVWPLAPFMTGPANVGSTAANTQGISNAFSDTTLLASLSKGTSPGDSIPLNAIMPVATVDTLANILAACVSTSGPTSSGCSTLFTSATANSVAPADTITAAVNMARSPGANVPALYSLSSTSAPFQPSLTSAPGDFLLAASFMLTNPSPTHLAVDASGYPWVSSSGGITRFTAAGLQVLNTTTITGTTGLAIDQSGNAWAVSANTLSKITPAGVVSSYTGNGLTSTSAGVAVDGQGQVWVANGTGGKISAFSSTGTAISGSPFTVPFNAVDIIFNTH